MNRKATAVVLLATSIASLALAQGAARDKLFGMRMFYEPDRVQRDEESVTLSLFRSGDPDAADEVGRFRINCQTRESVRLVNGQPSGQPSKVLAGEELYPVGKIFCEWEKKGFFEKLVN